MWQEVVMGSFEVCSGVAGAGLKKAREFVRTVGLRSEVLIQIQVNSANETFGNFHQATAKGKFWDGGAVAVRYADAVFCVLMRATIVIAHVIFCFPVSVYFEHQFVLFSVF
jgi:hypothetical protein